MLSFKEIDKLKLSVVGGKGANLGELSKIDRIRVPESINPLHLLLTAAIHSDLSLNGVVLLPSLTRL